VAAADVGDASAGNELGLHAIERWDPRAGEVVEVAGPEEAFATAEDMRIVSAPGKSSSGAKSLGDRIRGIHRADGDLKGTDHAGRAGFIGERDGVFVGQRESSGAVVGEVAAGRLGAGPLPYVSLGCAGAAGQSPGVSGPAPAIARYSPSLSPMTTIAPPSSAPTSPTAFSTNSVSFVSSIALFLSESL
jgi:hypothetical protein